MLHCLFSPGKIHIYIDLEKNNVSKKFFLVVYIQFNKLFKQMSILNYEKNKKKKNCTF